MLKELLHPDVWSPEVDPYSIPIEKIDMSNSDIFMHGDAIFPLFERLRKEDSELNINIDSLKNKILYNKENEV